MAATISKRMAEALAGARMAKNLYRDAQARFNAAVDANRDNGPLPEATIRELNELHDAKEAAKQAWIASSEAIRSAKLYDRRAWLHGNGKELTYA